jgi:hypothetical protein
MKRFAGGRNGHVTFVTAPAYLLLYDQHLLPPIIRSTAEKDQINSQDSAEHFLPDQSWRKVLTEGYEAEASDSEYCLDRTGLVLRTVA